MDEEKTVLNNSITDTNCDDSFAENNSDTSKMKVMVNPSKGATCVYDWVGCLLTAAVVVVIMLTFLFRMIDVDGNSMNNTLYNSDKVIVTNLFYTPKDGDIVVISHAQNYQKPIIKRVIATEGQTLDIDFETGEVVVDGIVLQEDYISSDTVKGTAEIPSVIPKGKVFVMGDNRSVSLDSRYEDIGLINVTDIIGEAQFVVFPFNHFGFLYN